MPSVGEQLRQAREKQNLSVQAVAEATKIKSDHIRALEESRYAAFAAPVYIRGFVRSYAKMLKLNVPGVLQDLDLELSEIEHFREPPSLTGYPQGFLDLILLQLTKVNWRVAAPILAALCLLVLMILVFRFWQSRPVEDPLKTLGPGIYQSRQTNRSGETLPLPAVPQPNPNR
jgi:cytoskeleton protein RodZ